MNSIKGSPKEGLFGATLGFFVGFAAVALFGPTASRFREVMDLSPVLVGVLVAMPALSGSLLRIPFSAWVDTTGGRKPFLVLLCLSVVGMLGLLYIVYFYYPENMDIKLYPLLLLFGVLSGCGIATFSVGISQVSYWHGQSQQGRALGTYAGFGNLAPGLFSFLLPVALSRWGLSGSYLAWLLFLIAGTVLYYVTGKNAWYFQYLRNGVAPDEARKQSEAAGQELFPAGSTLASLKISAAVWKTWALVGIYFTTFGGFIALTAWFPTYWRSFFEVSALMAGLLTALYSVLTSIIRVLGGRIADKLGGEVTLLLSLSAMLVGALLLALSSNLPISIGAEVILGMGMGIANAAVFKLVPQEVPQAVGGAAGWVGGLGAFGGFAIPPIMGTFVSSLGDVGYARGFLVFVLLAGLSIALSLALKWAHGRLGMAVVPGGK